MVGVLGRRLRLSGGIRGKQELGKGVGSESVLGRRNSICKAQMGATAGYGACQERQAASWCRNLSGRVRNGAK